MSTQELQQLLSDPEVSRDSGNHPGDDGGKRYVIKQRNCIQTGLTSKTVIASMCMSFHIFCMQQDLFNLFHLFQGRQIWEIQKQWRFP